MRKLVLGLLAAGSALAVAAPATAQMYPQHGAPYGNAYGFDNRGQVRALRARIEGVEQQIRMLDRRDMIRDRRADRLRAEARGIERRLRIASRNGLNPYEANAIRGQIARLEQRVQVAVANRGRYGDRDRAGRW